MENTFTKKELIELLGNAVKWAKMNGIDELKANEWQHKNRTTTEKEVGLSNYYYNVAYGKETLMRYTKKSLAKAFTDFCQMTRELAN